MTFQLRVRNLRFEPSSDNRDWAIVLDVMGDISVAVAGSELFNIHDGSAVELAARLADWRRSTPHGRFSYDPIESDSRGWIVFTPSKDGWVISGIGAALPTPAVAEVELLRGVDCYLDELRQQCIAGLGLDVERFVSGEFVF